MKFLDDPNLYARLVNCPLCDEEATLKPTTTSRLMLRCDSCKVLMFGNGEPSQKILDCLPDYGYCPISPTGSTFNSNFNKNHQQLPLPPKSIEKPFWMKDLDYFNFTYRYF